MPHLDEWTEALLSRLFDSWLTETENTRRNFTHTLDLVFDEALHPAEEVGVTRKWKEMDKNQEAVLSDTRELSGIKASAAQVGWRLLGNGCLATIFHSISHAKLSLQLVSTTNTPSTSLNFFLHVIYVTI